MKLRTSTTSYLVPAKTFIDMLSNVSNRYFSYRSVALPLALLLLFQTFLCVPVSAQSSGPLQPEFQQVQVVGSGDLVDPFTGDFQYSIPLIEIGGFPITLSYTSGQKMEDEASWVGFGWTLNPGAISRQVRGIPDDFKGDEITHTANMETSITTSISPGVDAEAFGIYGLGYNQNFSYNTLSGFSFSQNLSPSINILAALNKESYDEPKPSNEPKPKIGTTLFEGKFSPSISASINSRAGLEALSYGVSYNRYFSVRGSADFGGFTYTPVADLPRTFSATSRFLKTGLSPLWPMSFNTSFRSQSTIQTYEQNTLVNPAYGYLYLSEGQNKRDGLLDYNVEKSGLLPQNSPRLPMPFGTPDIFSVSGIGLAGQIQIQRNDVSVFRPAQVESSSVSRGRGGDVSVGPSIHLGVNGNNAKIYSAKKGWEQFNSHQPNLGYKENDKKEESVYFTFSSEMNARISEERFENAGGTLPVYLPLFKNIISGVITGQDFFEKTNSSYPGVSETIGTLLNWQSTERQYRANQVTFLTNREAALGGVDKELEIFFPLTGESSTNYKDFGSEDISRTDDGSEFSAHRRDHHVSEFRVTNASGQRFIYGLPVYNNFKQEITFDASGLPFGENGEPYGTVEISTDRLGIVRGDGEDAEPQFYDEVTTPAYTTAHLITSILSPDYVDVNDDGPSLDDLGQYIDINYSGIREPNQNPFMEWRVPSYENRATHYQGNLTDDDDDRGSFVLGQKELYYVHHIDSKTHRAVFITSERADSRLTGQDENGNDAVVGLRRLDKIKLFTLAEIEASGEDATPLKTVLFEYADDAESVGSMLSTAGEGNENVGKLTLKRVSFVYEDNLRGQQNPYEFSYKISADEDGIVKTRYEYGAVDRWGTQRALNADGLLMPHVFPYTIQNREEASKYCDLGNLREIKLPSGGSVEVNYEPDDYAYVQDKRAGRMFKVLGVSREEHEAEQPFLYNNGTFNNRSNLFLHVEVDNVTFVSEEEIDVERTIELYFEDVSQLFFDIGVELQANSGNYERVKGFAEFSKDLITVREGNESGTYRLVIRLRGLNRNNGFVDNTTSVHPFTYTALEKMRLEIPELVYDIDEASIEENGAMSGENLLSVLMQSGLSINNFYKWRMNQNDAKILDVNESFVRLADHSFKKIGGGARVFSVVLRDNWEPDLNDDQLSNSYEYEYKYEKREGGRTISSGVAANEPLIGRQENLMVNVTRSTQEKALAPNELFSLEGPLGMQFYPGPQVGYSRVAKKMVFNESVVQVSKPGSSVYEFYTARDFPIVVSLTSIEKERIKSLPLPLPLYSESWDRLGLSQGFSIQVNDMHGKPKSTKDYSFTNGLISQSLYKYVETVENGKRRPDNMVATALPNGTGREGRLLGLNEEIWIEAKEEENETEVSGAQANIDFQPFVWLAVGALPDYSSAQTSVRSIAVTKLITRKGILKEVEVTNNGSTLSTNNLVWDALTGAPLLTSTENEYDQPLYNMNLPAYFTQEHAGMGPAYENEGIVFRSVDITNGVPTCFECDFDAILKPGDELVILPQEGQSSLPEGQNRAIVALYEGEYVLLDDSGASHNLVGGPTIDLKIIRSGRRNMLSTPAGQTASLIPPNDGNYWDVEGTSGKVLASSAVTYSQYWGSQCIPDGDGGPVDPDCTSNICQNVSDDCTPCATQVINSIGTRLNSFSSFGDPDRDLEGFELESCEIDALIECDSCQALFDYVIEFGLVGNSLNYNCINDILVYTGNDANYISNCTFIDDVPWLTGTSVSCNYGDFATCPSVASKRADRWGCGDNAAPDDGAIMASALPPMPTECAIWQPGQPNPYLTGQLGSWRAQSTNVYQQANRVNSVENPTDGMLNPGNQPLIFRDGGIDNFIPFWSYGDRFNDGMSHILATKVINYDEHGNDLETIDAIMVPSAKQMGFHQQVPTAVAGNANRIDLGYESFEDYAFQRSGDPEVWKRHFGLIDQAEDDPATPNVDESTTQPGALSDLAAHTGKYSYQIDGGSGPLQAVYPTRYALLEELNAPACTESMDPLNCLNEFAPGVIMRGDPGDMGRMTVDEYHVSCWVANEYSLNYGKAAAAGKDCGPDGNCGSGHPAQLVIECFKDGAWTAVSTDPFLPSGPTVEGWQQITANFNIVNDGVEKVRFSLHPSSFGGAEVPFYFDDFKVHPREASVATYAFDAETLRLMAQSDDNGYATFYEYDDEGKLVRLKRETERGIMTVTEQQANITPLIEE